MKQFVLTLFLLAIVSVAPAADINIQNGTGTRISHSPRTLVFTSSTVGYFFTNNTNVIGYIKTTDGGSTWGSLVDVIGGATANSISADIWYDRWTPGDTGTMIHCWSVSDDTDNVYYRSLDTSSDTLGTLITLFDGATAVIGRGNFVSGTKARSGYLYAAFDIDAGAEKGFYRSTDGGANWSSLSATFVEATVDQCILFPASGTGDTNDIWAIYQDASTNELTMKMWDSSAAGAIESSSMQTMVENATDTFGLYGFNGAINTTTGDVFVVSFSELDTSTGDFQAWNVSAVNSGSQTGIAAKTNLTTNIDDMYYPSVFINSVNNDVYVAFNGKSDGSETLGTNTKIYYKKSTDGGTTWGSDVAVQQTAGNVDVRWTWTPITGNLFIVAWGSNAASPNDGSWTNVVASIPISTSQPNGFFQLINPGQ